MLNMCLRVCLWIISEKWRWSGRVEKVVLLKRGWGRGWEEEDEAACSFQKSAVFCAEGPRRPPTRDWGHLSAEIGASRWHFIWKCTQSCSELTRALDGRGDGRTHKLDRSHQEQETKGQLGSAEIEALGLENNETPWPFRKHTFPKTECFQVRSLFSEGCFLFLSIQFVSSVTSSEVENEADKFKGWPLNKQIKTQKAPHFTNNFKCKGSEIRKREEINKQMP